MKILGITGQHLKKLLVLLSPPLLVGLLAFRVFALLQDAYTSEAQLQVNEALWYESPEAERYSNETHPRVVKTMEEMQELYPFQFLAYALTLHDLDESNEPFGHAADSLLPAYWLTQRIKDTLIQRLATHQVMGEQPIDTTLREIFRRLKYQPHRLRSSIMINQIPGTSLVRLEADSRTPEMSTFVVNHFTQHFIAFRQGKERHRLTRIQDDLAKRVDAQKESLNLHQANLAAEQALFTDHLDDNAWELKRRIFRLEAAYEREKQRNQKLENRLARTRKRQQNIVRTRKGDSDPIELSLELETSHNRLEVLDHQINTLREQLVEYEAARLAPFSQRVEAQKVAYENIAGHFEKINQALSHVDHLLIQVVSGRTRHPIPYSAQVIGSLAGVTTFLLWLLFLLQIRYLRLT